MSSLTGELGSLAGMGLHVGYMARPTLYGPMVGPHARHFHSADILKVMDNIHLLLYQQPNKDGSFPHDINTVASDIMMTQVQNVDPYLSGYFRNNRNKTTIINFAGILSIMLGSNKVDIESALPKKYYKADGETAYFENVLSPSFIADTIPRLENFNPKYEDEMVETLRAQPVDKFSHPSTIKRVAYVAEHRVFINNYHAILSRILPKLGDGKSGILKYSNKSGFDMLPERSFDAAKKWGQRLQNSKIFSHMGQMRAAADKKEDVISVNEFLIFYFLLAGHISSRKDFDLCKLLSNFQGNAASDLKRLARSLGLRGWDEGGRFCISTLDGTNQPIVPVLLPHRVVNVGVHAVQDASRGNDVEEEYGGDNEENGRNEEDGGEAEEGGEEKDGGGDVFLADVPQLGGNDDAVQPVSAGNDVEQEKEDGEEEEESGGKEDSGEEEEESEEEEDSEEEEATGDDSKMSLEGDDPPWRTTGHRFLQRSVMWTPPRRNPIGLPCQPYIGTIVGWISENDKDKAGEPGFRCSRTKRPAKRFHIMFKTFYSDFEVSCVTFPVMLPMILKSASDMLFHGRAGMGGEGYFD